MAESKSPGRTGPTRGLRCQALLWRRSDFRESSRVVTLATREHGLVRALAKGAHRPDSPFLGRLDFLNELTIQLSAERGGLRLLLRADLVHERRNLRSTRRFLAASHLAFVSNFGFAPDQPSPELFDLLSGGLTLIERCPQAALRHVSLGLELRLLAQFGALPDLDHCCECGAELELAHHGEVAGGLACRRHAASPRRPVSSQTLQLLRGLRDSPGRSWPQLAQTPLSVADVALPAQWLASAIECRSPLRRQLFAETHPASQQHQRSTNQGRPRPDNAVPAVDNDG